MSEGEGASAPELRPYTRPWVMALLLREQGTLLAGIRGCDTVVDQFIPGTTADPLNRFHRWTQVRHPTKAVVAALRYIVGTPHDPREVDAAGGFMASTLPEIDTWPVKCLDDLPLHFVMHLMHAVEVVAYRGPRNAYIKWLDLYYRICDHMHVEPESRERMIERLSEDRIALGTVKEVPKPSSYVGLDLEGRPVRRRYAPHKEYP